MARAVELLDHRGPDDHGIWGDETTLLGHTRLSIIDLGGSTQPMASGDGRYQLVFNGEILNYHELRAALGDRTFRTSGDTETLLATMETFGIDGLDKMRGQFAFALYDTTDNSLLLARDRMGVLPLYYGRFGDQVVFGSEIKALHAAADQRPEVDPGTLDGFLAHRTVPAPETLFKGIRKVRPGHFVRIASDGSITERPYWSVDDIEPRDVSPEEAVELVAAQLRESVQEALIADVPVGAYLSGEVESSLIVALIAELRGSAPLSTFSAGFTDSPLNELPYARQVADLLGTDHHETIIDPDTFESNWAKLTWHRDAPLSEPADIAVFQLASMARQHVKVVLSGEGSDELFAGYPKYRAAATANRLGALPNVVRQPAARLIERGLPVGQSKLRTAVRSLSGSTRAERHRSWFAPFTEQERAQLLGRPPRRAADPAEGLHVIDEMLRADLTAWLADNLLERGDRMSMAASLELRPPFLDPRLVELAFSLPPSVKVRDGVTKWVLKEVARRHLPESIVDRRKVGFRVPLEAWFRTGLRDMAHDRLLNPSGFVGTHLDRDVVAGLLDSHDRGRRDEENRIWTLLCLEMWHEVFFTGPQAFVPAEA